MGRSGPRGTAAQEWEGRSGQPSPAGPGGGTRGSRICSPGEMREGQWLGPLAILAACLSLRCWESLLGMHCLTCDLSLKPPPTPTLELQEGEGPGCFPRGGMPVSWPLGTSCPLGTACLPLCLKQHPPLPPPPLVAAVCRLPVGPSAPRPSPLWDTERGTSRDKGQARKAPVGNAAQGRWCTRNSSGAGSGAWGGGAG